MGIKISVVLQHLPSTATLQLGLNSERDHIRVVRPINDFGGRLFKDYFYGCSLGSIPTPLVATSPKKVSTVNASSITIV